VEETAIAVEALLSLEPRAAATQRGLAWLMEAVETGRAESASPIGLYFAKLWYYEKLYPLIFVTSALGSATKLYAAMDNSLPEPAMTG
jgi:squalene-hopene/tetraprenyl-beta-curcumene cyclase